MVVVEAPAAAPVRPRPQHRRTDIQGLRAVAVLLVVLYHAGAGLSGGFVGVDVFFVISGFVISGLLLRELTATGRISLVAFYVRRARRLLPALALVSVVTLAAGALLLSPVDETQRVTGRAAAAAALFFANGYFFLSSGGYFQQHAEANPFLHTWSLSVEEQFYLGFPLLLLLGWRLQQRFRRRYPIVLVGLVLVGSLAAGVAFTYAWLPGLPSFATYPDIAMRFAFYSPLTRAWEFLAGAAVALLCARRGVAHRWATPSAVAGVALLLVAAFGIDATDRFPGILAGLPVAATVCLLLAGSAARSNPVSRGLSLGPLVALGDLSYSWYLWHWPVIVFAKAWFPQVPLVGLLAAAASLVPAVASYRLVERPIHLGRRLPSRRAVAALAVVCVATPLAAGAGLVAAVDRSWGRDDLAAVQAAVRPAHADLVSGCASTAPLGSAARPACLWTTPGARGTILLIGDSNAGHLTEPMIGAARDLGMDLQVATSGGCPFLLRPRYFSDACRQFVEGSLAALTARSAGYAAVVVSNASVGYLNGPLATGLAADAPPGTPDGQRQRAVAGWASDLGRTVAAVGSHSPVVVIGAVPQYANFPGCLARSVLASRAPGCGELASGEATRVRADIVAAERGTVRGLAATYLDTGDRLCRPAGGCSAFVDGRIVYRDGAHLSVAGSELFRADLREALRPLVAVHHETPR
ncbi:acyltransferase family protein [Micromonospora auratinigra]|uniref:Peptidoglycan/LPS O-acetylase OafA/YrhL, contains acyltransferase and SGNH-hydrolase domains n=1 Tax=Micromonospora auratinigra TaxID=261654 RepID=A0A1A8Z1V4_9ACTN|nr:acyltransferase family protein [Micromonospora auratinigra]SBT37742.1 Peptidoglycan/LPS O-acetylase OafA/YrhL, contains acyltransferase and SGNH-hydrolase domains [Micromonospora auratinigra]